MSWLPADGMPTSRGHAPAVLESTKQPETLAELNAENTMTRNVNVVDEQLRGEQVHEIEVVI